MEELQRFNAAVDGREERMIELKKGINSVLERLGEPLTVLDIPGCRTRVKERRKLNGPACARHLWINGQSRSQEKS